jgi:CDP-glucose 4,6-dehydratase
MMNWIGRPVLVTGATGLLGGWLVQHLLQIQADVVCLVRDWVPQSLLFNAEVSRVIKVVRGDVREQPLLERLLGEYEIKTVFHLAAQTIVGIANRNPVSTFEANIQGTWALLEACRRSPLVETIIVASSDKAYGSHVSLPYSESTPLQGRHPYDVSKSCADLIAQAYASTYGTQVGVTRCGNFYGGGDLNWNRIVPGTIRSALKGERPVIRSDGKLLRDYLYVLDGVSAYITLAEALADGRATPGAAYNFGHNQPISVLDLVNLILARCGREDLQPDVRNEALNEIPNQYLDPTRAHRDLSWHPRFSHDAGIAEAVEWYRHFLKGQGCAH